VRAIRDLGLVVLLLACVLAPIGPTGPLPSRAADDETLSYSDLLWPVLDPAWTRNENDERLVLALFDGLTARDPATGQIVPAAAERWEEAADGLSWTFHLVREAVWSDGKPVKAADFAAAWKRALDPYEPSVHASAFRVLKGCAAIADGDRAMRAFSAASKGVDELLDEHGDGIPGKALADLLDQSGVRALAATLDDASVKRLLKWGTDKFPADKAQEVRQAFKTARRAYKSQVYDAFDAFGKDVAVRVVDDHTLVVLLEHACPWLPDLVSGSAFVPLHPETVSGGERAFDPSALLTNGAYRLKGRGPKPRPDLPNPESLVHLVRSPSYAGPLPGQMPEIYSYTGQGASEDLRRLENGEVQWMARASAQTQKQTASIPGYQVRPAGPLLVLRLRADRPPFDQPEVRKALALAIDRSRLKRTLWPEPDEAWRLVPTDVAGPGAAPGAPRPDVQAAKKLLAAAGLAGGDFPWVELHYEDRADAGLDDLADALTTHWEKSLGAQLGLRIEDPEMARKVRAAGAYQMALGTLEGQASDPGAWILPLGAGHPESGLGWDDADFEALLAAALDLDGLLAGGEDAASALPEAASFRTRVDAARRGGAREKDALRRALLQAAEARVLDACVVIPLVWPARASVEKGVRGVGSEAAWRHPTFVGSLRSATRAR
jgi:oligopeptide transport system substrate-binding protein